MKRYSGLHDKLCPINFKITKYDWRIYTKSKKEKVKPQT